MILCGSGKLKSASSAPAGSGCSINSILASAAAARKGCSMSGVHASLASANKRTSGRAARTARIRSGSAAPPSLSLSSGSLGTARAAAAMSAGVPRLIVNAVSRGDRVIFPAQFATVVLRCLASNCQVAQSSALRAAPAGSCFCRSWRSVNRAAKIAAITLSTVSP